MVCVFLSVHGTPSNILHIYSLTMAQQMIHHEHVISIINVPMAQAVSFAVVRI